MKLAEALSLRADLQKRIAQIQRRLQASCKVQEGDAPAENPEELMKELQDNLDQLEQLMVRINKTNQMTVLDDGKTITEKIAKRDVMTKQVSILQQLLDYLMTREERYSRNEIKYVFTVSVSSIQKQADDCSKRLRAVDVEIQSVNWTVELCE